MPPFAWSLKSNHFHLAIRSRAVPISHGMHYLQGRFSQRFNRSRKRTGPERPEVSAAEFVNACAAILQVGVEELTSRSRQRPVVEDRRLIVTLGRERWGQRTKELASVLKKSADTVSYLTREGIRLRLEDQAFARRYEGLDAGMIARGRPATEEADDP